MSALEKCLADTLFSNKMSSSSTVLFLGSGMQRYVNTSEINDVPAQKNAVLAPQFQADELS